MKVLCDKCKSNFKIKPKMEKLEKEIEFHYFDCPICFKRYETHKTNTITRELQARLTQGDIESNSVLYKEYQEEYKKLNK